ncbi:hypothetical protein HYT54_03785 [Candidatus Woesearchaeota archaeon]|nr:hypothetical protein [Candidatus Woesearchaeota archaeon]
MKLANRIEITVFSYHDERSDMISEGIAGLLPFNLEDEKLAVQTSTAGGFNEKPITTFKLVLIKGAHTSKFLKHILGLLDSHGKKTLLSQLDSRIDEDLNFYLRIGKDEWLQDRKLAITDSGKCFHIKVSMAAFPRKRENAIKLISGWLNQ